MLRNSMIVAIVGIAALSGSPAAQAQNYTWGVFRENVLNVPDNLRNCWTQAMVSGQTINGELIAERLTQQQAQVALTREARKGLCASQRSAPSWTARQEADGTLNSDWSNSGGSNSGGSGSGSSGFIGGHRQRSNTAGSGTSGSDTTNSDTSGTGTTTADTTNSATTDPVSSGSNTTAPNPGP